MSRNTKFSGHMRESFNNVLKIFPLIQLYSFQTDQIYNADGISLLKYIFFTSVWAWKHRKKAKVSLTWSLHCFNEANCSFLYVRIYSRMVLECVWKIPTVDTRVIASSWNSSAFRWFLDAISCQMSCYNFLLE